MNRTKLTEYVALKREKAQVEARLRVINGELSSLEEQLLDQFADDGITKVGTDDGATVFIHSQLWASPKEDEREALVAALRENGLEDYTTINHQSFSGFVRELVREAGAEKDDEIDMEAVAPGWGKHVKVARKVSLNVRNG